MSQGQLFIDYGRIETQTMELDVFDTTSNRADFVIITVMSARRQNSIEIAERDFDKFLTAVVKVAAELSK